MNIQIPFKCINYIENFNLNITCKNKTRCKVYYDEFCDEYKEYNNNEISENSNGIRKISGL